MKFGIGATLVGLVTILVVVTAGSLFWVAERGAGEVVLDHEVIDLGDETRLRASELLFEIYSLRGDVQRLAWTLPWYLREKQTADVEDLCRREYYHPNYLWLEVITLDGNLEKTVVALHTSGVSIENRDEFLSLVKAYAPDSSQTDRTIVSEVLRVRVEADHEDSQPPDKANVVWAGTHVRLGTDSAAPGLVVIGALDLDADLPAGVSGDGDDRSPLRRVDTSPRHLAVLANAPKDGLPFTADLLTYPDDMTLQPLRPEDLVEPFQRLYEDRDRVVEVCNGHEPKVEPRQLISLSQRELKNITGRETLRLRDTLYFVQSRDLPGEQFDKAKERVSAFAQTVKSGQRIGLLTGGVKNVRLLARSKAELLDLQKRISVELRKLKIDVSWQDEVPCGVCHIQFVLFPVRSDDMESKGFKRYYGLAQAAFSEEMIADVGQRMEDLAWRGAAFVLLAAGLGFVCSLFFTRPLKQITATAQAVAEAEIDLDPANGSWREGVSVIAERLPVKRHDEIGVLARAFSQMLDEVIEGHERLRELNAGLDRRVRERTEELELANEELKAARDKAHELSRAKDAFLASVSHELRNPLNQVSGFCQLIELTDLDDEQRADLQKIRLAANQLLALINDILDYQKIIMGGITLEPEDIQVSELLKEVGDAMEFQARENRNCLEVHCDDDVGSLYADQQRVRQVLLNLTGNACKLTWDGTVSLRASRVQNGNGDVIQFDVIDTGRGMTPEEQAKLFRPFVKLAAKQGNRSGTGLGLVICKGFCDMMHGDISVRSEFGKGSTFTVRLPADTTSGRVAGPPSKADVAPTPPAADEPPAKKAKPPVTEPERPKPTPLDGTGLAKAVEKASPAGSARVVLVVDDDANVREMMHRYLEAQGFRVITASSGLEGLEVAKRIRPTVITLDAIMPGLDGWAVLAALRTDRETANIPVVMVTIDDDEERGYSLGAAEFVTKPVEWEALSEVLAKYTGNKRDPSILVVDDEPKDREILRRNLERDGWKVLEAEHGKAALELLATERPAAILLDLMMPVMDGFEFLAEYCQLAEWLSIPVVVTTAKDPTPEELERLEGLVVRVLQKGQYSYDDLLREIHRRVDKHIRSDTSERKKEHDVQDTSG